ncbi:hypothetical protein HC766_04080 [Candidatus Gracilibacteria bacterium]|nr:hypothetical protein [Candidatus Gracilibacteria bacterium]
MSEQSYISIKKIINFLYNSIDNINDNTKLDKTLQSIRFSINAHLINVTEGSAFDYIQNSVIKPLKKLQDLNKGTNISNPTTIKNYLKIYAKKLEKIQDPTIQKTREKNIINIDAIKINKLINTTQEILISLKTDLKNLSQTNSQTVEQLKILQTEFTYSTQQITNDEQIFERFNKKIQQIIDNGQKTSPTLLAVDLSIAHSILSKSKQTLKPQPTIIESSEPINQPQNNIEDLREAIVIESDSPKNESGFDENVVMESELNSPQTSYQIQETINPIENQDTDNTEFIVESIRNNIKHINNEIQNNSHILYVIFQDEINPDLSVKFNILGRDINATLKKELETQIISDYNYNLGQFDTPIGHYNLDNLGTNDWQPKEMQRVIAAYEKLSQQFTKESLVALEIPHFETDQEELQVNAQDKSEEEVTQSLASQTSKESETPAKESIQKDDTPNQDNTDGSSEEIAQSKSESPKIMKRSNLAKIPGKLENFKAEMVAAQQRLAAKDIDINIDELESSIASTHQFLMDKSILLDSGNYRNEYLLIPKFQKLAQENNYQTTERDGKRFINKEKYFELQLIDMNNYVHSQQNQTSKTIIKNVERPKSTQKEKPITNQSSNSNSNSGFTIDNDAFMNALMVIMYLIQQIMMI